MISPLAGITATKPGAAQVAIPGITVKVVGEDGVELGNEESGFLTVSEPWPSMLRGIWGDSKRFQETYWDRFPGKYFAGDGAKKDADGDIWILGRVDDVIKVAGHRLSSTEIESALVSHPFVAEAAVVGANDPITGQAVVAFVILRLDQVEAAGSDEHVGRLLREHVAKEIGAIARPRQIMVVAELPKTRSGKIMRRLLRDVAEDRPIGDVTTLADTSVMSSITAKLAAGATD
jgi:acetyl-CoA synthetase